MKNIEYGQMAEVYDLLYKNKKLKACHIFKIYNINKLNKIALDLGFTSVKFYENYNKNTLATSNSKNIQMVMK